MKAIIFWCFLLFTVYFNFLYTEGIRSEEDTETAHGTLRDLERMKLCMEFVREHYGERISLADAAGLLAITPEHFCRLFRKYTGQTFLAYVNQIRMEHFHTDLLETDKIYISSG